MGESIQKKLGRVRPPRVHITYDVETGGARQKKELPFIVGVMADLTGKRAEELPPIKARRFVEIDRDNFNKVLQSSKTRAVMRVKNCLDADKKESEYLNVELNFKSLDDFDPGKIIQQVEPLRKLYEARTRLCDLIAKLDGNDKLEKLLLGIVKEPEKLKAIKQQAFGENKPKQPSDK